MKKTLLAFSFLVLTASLARAGCAGCKGDCPSMVEGAATVVENTADGVAIHVTAKDPAAVKKIQEAAAEHFAKNPSGRCLKCKKDHKCPKCAAKHGGKGRWVCPMGCAHADQPGKCPKCKMEMKEESAAAEKNKPQN